LLIKRKTNLILAKKLNNLKLLFLAKIYYILVFDTIVQAKSIEQQAIIQ